MLTTRAIDRQLRAQRLGKTLRYAMFENGNIVIGERSERGWGVIYATWNSTKNNGKITTIWSFGMYQAEPYGLSFYKTFDGWVKGVARVLGIEIPTQ